MEFFGGEYIRKYKRQLYLWEIFLSYKIGGVDLASNHKYYWKIW